MKEPAPRRIRRGVLLAGVILVVAGGLRLRSREAASPPEPPRPRAPAGGQGGARRTQRESPPRPAGDASAAGSADPAPDRTTPPEETSSKLTAADRLDADTTETVESPGHGEVLPEDRPPRALMAGGCGSPHPPAAEPAAPLPAAGVNPPVVPIKRSTFFDWTPALTGAPLDPRTLSDGDCLGMFPGNPVWEGRVPASTIPVEVDVAPGTYVVVARGRFRFSGTGHQDAMRRWHEPLPPAPFVTRFEPKCTGCDFDPSFRPWSFLADGAVPVFLRECPFRHASAHLARARSNRLILQIRDNNPDDNAGDLAIAIHATADSDPLAGAERPGQRLGQPVGALLGERELRTFEYETAWDVEGEAFLVELAGLGATAPGIEQDALYRWDFPNESVTPAALVELRCRAVRPVAMQPAAHRYLIAASDCGGPLAARVTPGIEILGKIRMMAFAPAGAQTAR